MQRDGSTPQTAIQVPSGRDEKGLDAGPGTRYAAREHHGQWHEAEKEVARGGFTVLAYCLRARNPQYPYLEDGIHIEVVRYQDDRGYLLEGPCTRPSVGREQFNRTKRYAQKATAYKAAQRFLDDALRFLGDVDWHPQLSLDQVRALLQKYDGVWFELDHRSQERQVACKALWELHLIHATACQEDHDEVYELLALAGMVVPQPRFAGASARRFLWTHGMKDAAVAGLDAKEA